MKNLEFLIFDRASKFLFVAFCQLAFLGLSHFSFILLVSDFKSQISNSFFLKTLN